MEFEKVLENRRSIRKFSDRDVPDELIKSLIDCALMAPSSMNGQPWNFIIVRDAETKRRLTETKNKYCPPDKKDYSADFLNEAPLLILTCVDRARAFDRGIENGVLATANLLLAAANYGLTSVYMSAYTPGVPEVADEIRSILNIPPDIDPITLVPIGYPGGTPEQKIIKSAEEVVFNEAFGRK
jgi:nitroreductase